MPAGVSLKLDEQAIAAVKHGVELGMYAYRAAEGAGVAGRTLRRWVEQGENDIEDGLSGGESIYVRLVEAIKAAESVYQKRMLERIDAAAKLPQHWAAAMTGLERRFPAEYGQKSTVTVDNPAQARFARMVEKLVLDPGPTDNQSPALQSATTEGKWKDVTP